LDLKGAIVTIDAMGCQKAIVEIITEKGGDYVIALKGNQGTLHEDVVLFLEKEITKNKENLSCVYHEECDKGHGRIEIRKHWITDKIDWLDNKEQWPGLKSIAVIESERIKNNNSSIERRYYISSLSANAQMLSSAVRSHWGVENNLHWVLDVTFGEDASRVRNENAAENMAIIRHTALNLLQQAKKSYKDTSIKGLRKKAGWGNSTLTDILVQHF
jgi:predicted transposase YbfD/YdcC